MINGNGKLFDSSTCLQSSYHLDTLKTLTIGLSQYWKTFGASGLTRGRSKGDCAKDPGSSTVEMLHNTVPVGHIRKYLEKERWALLCSTALFL